MQHFNNNRVPCMRPSPAHIRADGGNYGKEAQILRFFGERLRRPPLPGWGGAEGGVVRR
jgi:hypothetical protein